MPLTSFPHDGELVGIKVFKGVADSIPMSQFTLARRMTSQGDPFNHFWLVDTNNQILLEDWEIEEWFSGNDP